MSQNVTPMLPAVFGRYVLLHRISRGGMGEIFLAKLGEIQGFEKPIVIKKILPHLAQDQDFLQRFIEEAQIAIKLSHGNIVPVYEVGMVSNEYFLAMQYVEGRDLRSVLTRCRDRHQRFTPELALFLAREITNGLAYAHRRTDEAGRPLNLVHCDISPPNILVTFEGEVKIIDFGIAKSAMQRAQANEDIGFGKFGYMAPEQLLRGAAVDRRADIYSTGVILYEMLTGERVFTFPAGADYRHVARVVTAGKIASPSEVDFKLSDRFDQLVLRSLRTEPTERYQSAEEFRDEIQQHLYSLNMTISADAIAAFVRTLFAEEIEADRNMLRSLSQTDVESFRMELNDGSSHTVSYAMAGLLTQGSNVARVELTPPMSLAEARASAAVIDPLSSLAASTEQQKPEIKIKESEERGPGTRRLSNDEQKRALSNVEPLPSGETLAILKKKRWLWVSLSGVLVAVLVIGGLVAAMIKDKPAKRTTLAESGAGHDATARPKTGARDLSPPADLARSTPEEQGHAGVTKDAGTGEQGAGLVHLTFPPQTVHRSDYKKSRKSVGKKKRVLKSARSKRVSKKKKPAKKTMSISAAMVQKKFRQVRREYERFNKSYGRRLEKEWQEIMFSNTFDNMDENKYIRLNVMLDDLRRRMKKLREGG